MEAKQSEKERVRDDLFEQVLSSENMTRAWKQVKANKGAAGVDGMGVGEFPVFIRSHWGTIAAKLRDGNYRPSPVRRVLIPKGRGAFRTLGIPTVLDRVIQQAIAQVLGEIHEPKFSEHSYGFRPRRSAHQAIEAMRTMSLNKGQGRTPLPCRRLRSGDLLRHRKPPEDDGQAARERQRRPSAGTHREVPESWSHPARRNPRRE
ncbi:MAG: reverse transcriptase domain-containing protein [Luteolibacter sp.]